MNRIIAKAFLCLLLLPMMAVGQNTNTNTINVTYTFTDFNLTPQAVRRATQTPLAPFADFNGSILTASPIAKVTSGAGSVTFSNTVAGYSYRIQLDTPFGSTVRTSGFPALLTGNVNGRDYLGEIRNQNFYYLYPNNTTLLISNALNSVGFNPANFIASANGTGAGTTTFTNGAGAQIQLQNGGTTGTLTLDPSGITASSPINSQTINGTFGNFTSVQGGFFHGDGGGLTNLQVPVGVVTVTNAIQNNNGIGTNPTFVGVTTFPVGAVLNAQNASILVSNVIANGPVFANAGLVTTGIGATSLNSSGGIQGSTGQFGSDVTVLGNLHFPSNNMTVGNNFTASTNFTVGGLNLMRGKFNSDLIEPYTTPSTPGWSIVVNGSHAMDLTDTPHGGVLFGVPVTGIFTGIGTGAFAGDGTGLTGMTFPQLGGNVPVVGLTNALGQMIVGSGSITVTPSGNSIVIGGGGSGPGGSATNAIGNNGGSGTNTFLYTQTTFHGLISGDATGTLLGVTTGASTNLASLGPITNQVLGAKVVGQVAGATNAVNATNLIGTLAATQLTGNVPLAQLTNAALIHAGLNITIPTNADGSLVINAAVGTNGLLVPVGMTDYVSSAGYTFSNGVTHAFRTVDTNLHVFSSLTTPLRTFYVSPTGNNSTALINYPDLPFAPDFTTNGQLYLQATNPGDLILVSPGDYFITNVWINKGVTFQGLGFPVFHGVTNGATTANGPSFSTSAFQVSDNCTVRGIVWEATNNWGNATAQNGSGPGTQAYFNSFMCGNLTLFTLQGGEPVLFTNVTVDNCHLFGGSDIFYGNNHGTCYLTVQNSIIFGFWDLAVQFAGTIVSKNNVWTGGTNTAWQTHIAVGFLDDGSSIFNNLSAASGNTTATFLGSTFNGTNFENLVALPSAGGFYYDQYAGFTKSLGPDGGTYLTNSTTTNSFNVWNTNVIYIYGIGDFVVLNKGYTNANFNGVSSNGTLSTGTGSWTNSTFTVTLNDPTVTNLLGSISDCWGVKTNSNGGYAYVVAGQLVSGVQTLEGPPPSYGNTGFISLGTNFIQTNIIPALYPALFGGAISYTNSIRIKPDLTLTGHFSATNSGAVGGAGITNGAITATNFKTPTNASTAGQTIMATSAAGDTAWTNFSAAWLTGTLPQSTLGSYVVTNGMTNVALANFKVPTNAPALNNIIRCTTNDSTTAWVDPTGGTPSLVINAPIAVTNAAFIGTPKDCAFILNWGTGTNVQQNGSNYITINLGAPALSTNPVVAIYSVYGGNTAGCPTNTVSGLNGVTSKYQLMTTSNSVILNTFATPAASTTNTIAVQVTRF